MRKLVSFLLGPDLGFLLSFFLFSGVCDDDGRERGEM